MNAVRRRLGRVVLSIALFVGISVAAQAELAKGKVILVLDDVGYRQSDIAAFGLPVEVAFSILPQTPHARTYAEMANRQGRDVMLHLPMASMSSANLGPAALTVGMYREDIESTLNAALDSVPYVVGVNNHMGSALTAQPDAMNDLMRALKHRSLFFLDSRTTASSIAYETARDWGLPTDKRHIFLDHEQSEVFYQKQFERLIRIAKKHGRAIGIAHPYPSSLAFLSKALKNIEQYGVELYPVSTFFAQQQRNQRRNFATNAELAAPSE